MWTVFDQEMQELKEIAKYINMGVDEIQQKRIYNIMEDEITIEMGKDTRILIISDCFYKTASELHYFIEKHTDAKVLGVVDNMDDTLRIAERDDFDYYFIIGYLHDHCNYKKLIELKKMKPRMKSIMWVRIDDIIVNFCRQFKIDYYIDINKPVDEFLREIVNINSKRDERL